MSVEEKAARLLREGRVTLWADAAGLRAIVEGDHGTYAIAFPRSGPSCPCAAWSRRCSHVRAVELVTGGRRRVTRSGVTPAPGERLRDA